ncbi:Glutamate dehydrogenase [Carpediemonas membranifera]|uniref:Glutamate dehydrogenase n=1 Tax=Carpediemonas membranifera TaxID=201153 RepID=A0A8J6B552_9EUKA|nr:Glutamate dehydrogenase [Carpediemonas membranifera]|eukprot:KAG9395868.1 Glutamate dehydrogenase [Carpediemonas membranifera]
MEARLTAQLAERTEMMRALQTNYDTLRRESETNKKELMSLCSEVQDLRQTAKDHEQAMAKIASLEAEKREMSFRLADLEDAIQDREKAAGSANGTVETLKKTIADLEQELTIHGTSNRSLEEEVYRLRTRLERTEAINRDMNAQLTGVERQKADLIRELTEASEKVENLSVTNYRAADDSRRVMRMMENKDKVVKQLRMQLQEAKNELASTTATIGQLEARGQIPAGSDGLGQTMSTLNITARSYFDPAPPADVAAMHAELVDLRAKLGEKEAAWLSTREKLEGQLANEKHTVLTMAADNEKHMKTIMRLRTEMTELKVDHRKQCDTLEEEIAVLKESASGAECGAVAKLEAAYSQVADLKGQLSAAKARACAAEKEAEAAKSQAASDVAYMRQQRADTAARFTADIEALKRQLASSQERVSVVEEQLRREVGGFGDQLAAVERERDDAIGQLANEKRVNELGQVEHAQRFNAFNNAQQALSSLVQSLVSIENELIDIETVDTIDNPICLSPCGHTVSGPDAPDVCPDCHSHVETSVPNVTLDNVMALIAFHRQVVAGMEGALRAQ